jgi:hypothetical protein
MSRLLVKDEILIDWKRKDCDVEGRLGASFLGHSEMLEVEDGIQIS